MLVQHTSYIEWLALGVLLGLALYGCTDPAALDRPRLLHTEQAMVGNADWIRSSGNTLQAANNQVDGLMTIDAVACRRRDPTGERPKLVIHEPLCESFVLRSEDPGRID